MAIPAERGEPIEMSHNRPLELSVAQDDERRRGEFALRLIELADDFDHIDHEYGPVGGTDLQADCQAVRDFARNLSAARFPN